MKKYVFILSLIFVVLLSGCKGSDNKAKKVQMDTENKLTFTMTSEPVNPGTDVIVHVNTKNNPGFLTMAVKVEYDTKAMSLVEVSNGSDFVDYNFIPPKNLQSGCKISWFITDLPNNPVDGELIELHFYVFDDTAIGEYPITISPINDGGIVDGNKNLITVIESNDVIKVQN